MNQPLSRRGFLKGAALFSSLGLAPQFLTRTVEAALTGREAANDRILVVLQLGGGNDGLNTLVPHGEDAYYRARPTLSLRKGRLLPLNDAVALNARLEGLMRLYDDGEVGVIQGVGYPNPDRSHFRSMEIWQTASDADEFLGHGWLGRYFDAACDGASKPQVGVAIGERPQAFQGELGLGIAFDRPDTFGYREGEGMATEDTFARLNAPASSGNTSLDFLRHTASHAILSAHEVREAAVRGGFEPVRGQNPLLTVASLIRGGLDTRVYFVDFGGFDTHAGQAGIHDRLLEQVGNALQAFQRQLKKDGTDDRVMTLVFSEFGRRVAENGSAGTDHGTAAPMFVIGRHAAPGLHGVYPSLTDLDNGDLKYTVDFRRVYASMLEQWLEVDSREVLGQGFEPLAITS
jgi:uncharacterized protein (DUF1501 family)